MRVKDPATRDARIRMRFLSGQTMKQIGDAEGGITRVWVHQILRRMGISADQGGKNIARREALATGSRKNFIAYRMQRTNARIRGVEFNITFKQWMDFWGDDLLRRGRGKNLLAMCRYGDAGPYAVGNIYKGTLVENFTHYRERIKAKK